MHWLIDDTWWDENEPASTVGTILANDREVAAVAAVLTPLLAMIDELGDAADDAFLTHHRWPEVAGAASEAQQLLESRAEGPEEH